MSAAILVPLDGSAFAEQALPIARGLAARLDAPLHLVAVYQPFVTRQTVPTYDRSFDDEQRTALADRLRARAEALEPLVPGGVTHEVVESADVADALIAEAERTGARLIVTTTHGRGGFQRMWLGSVAAALVRRAARPVLLVRPGEQQVPGVTPSAEEAGVAADAPPLAPFRRVLLPLDGTPLSEEAIEPALALAAAEGAAVRLLRVVQVPPTRIDPEQTFWTPRERDAIEELRAEAVAYLEDVVRSRMPSFVDASTTVALHASPASAIVAEAESWGADLIALSTHAREGVERMMVGSVADKVYRAAPVPTLVVHPSR